MVRGRAVPHFIIFARPELGLGMAPLGRAGVHQILGTPDRAAVHVGSVPITRSTSPPG